MARAGILDHPKFKRYVFKMGEPVAHCLGYLECLWQTAHQLRNAKIGDELDVEINCGYPGDPGKCFASLLECRLIDEIDGVFYVHDFMDHCPNHVKKAVSRKQKAPKPKHGDAVPKISKDGDQVGNNVPKVAATLEPNGYGVPTVGDKEERREKREKELPPTPLKIEPSAELANLWRFHKKTHSDYDRNADGYFADLLREGVAKTAIEKEIVNPERSKNRETIWDFCDRLSPKKKAANGNTVGSSRIEVAASEVERRRQKRAAEEAARSSQVGVEKTPPRAGPATGADTGAA